MLPKSRNEWFVSGPPCVQHIYTYILNSNLICSPAHHLYRWVKVPPKYAVTTRKPIFNSMKEKYTYYKATT